MEPIPQNWSQSTILQEGLSFLQTKKQELDLASKLWGASYHEASFYEKESVAAAERYLKIATKNMEEVGLFHLAVKEAIEANLANPASAETNEKLAHIALISRYAVEYFVSAVKHTQYPDIKEHNFRIAATLSGSLAAFAPTLTLLFNSCSGRCSAASLFGPTLLCMATWLTSGILGLSESDEQLLSERKVRLETALGQKTQDVHRKPGLSYGIHPLILGAGIASWAIVMDINNKLDPYS